MTNQKLIFTLFISSIILFTSISSAYDTSSLTQLAGDYESIDGEYTSYLPNMISIANSTGPYEDGFAFQTTITYYWNYDINCDMSYQDLYFVGQGIANLSQIEQGYITLNWVWAPSQPFGGLVQGSMSAIYNISNNTLIISITPSCSNVSFTGIFTQKPLPIPNLIGSYNLQAFVPSSNILNEYCFPSSLIIESLANQPTYNVEYQLWQFSYNYNLNFPDIEACDTEEFLQSSISIASGSYNIFEDQESFDFTFCNGIQGVAHNNGTIGITQNLDGYTLFYLMNKANTTIIA